MPGVGQKREVERAKPWCCTWLSVCVRLHGSGWIWVLVHRVDGLREGMGGQARTCKWRENDGSEVHLGPTHSISTTLVFTWLSESMKLLSPTLMKSGELNEVCLYGEWRQETVVNVGTMTPCLRKELWRVAIRGPVGIHLFLWDLWSLRHMQT